MKNLALKVYENVGNGHLTTSLCFDVFDAYAERNRCNVYVIIVMCCM